jgi:hypothetical protein
MTCAAGSGGIDRAKITIRVANRFNRAASSFACEDTSLALQKTSQSQGPPTVASWKQERTIGHERRAQHRKFCDALS